jgi:hypothetical protein
MSTVTERAPSSFAIPDFSVQPPITLHGSAAISGTALRLTPAAFGQAGAAWYARSVRVSEGFTTDFRYRLARQGGDDDELGTLGADGFAFVVRGPASEPLGDAGAGMGYQGIDHSLAVEFDTYLNASVENSYSPADLDSNGKLPPGDHISINTLGPAENTAWHPASLGYTTRQLSLATPRGAPRSVRISYRPPIDRRPPRIRVFLDDLATPVLEVALEKPLEQVLGLGPDATARVGFTAATGSGWEEHDIVSWSFTTLLGPNA